MKVRKYNDRALRVDHFHDAHIKILSKMHDYDPLHCSIQDSIAMDILESEYRYRSIDLVSHIDFLRYKYIFMINLLLITCLIR